MRIAVVSQLRDASKYLGFMLLNSTYAYNEITDTRFVIRPICLFTIGVSMFLVKQMCG